MAVLIFLLGKSAAHQGRDAKHGKHTCSKPRGIDLCRIARAGKFIIGGLVSAQAGEDGGIAHIGANAGGGDGRRAGAVLRAFHDIAKRDQLGLIGKRQRPEQHTFHDGEDGRGGADAEGQREDRGQCESGRLAQLTQRIAHVLQ